MTLRDVISRLLDDDRLQDAIGLAREHVKTKPTDKDGRHFYIDLLVLAGDYEKADAQCNLAATFSPQESVGFSLFRHQLRAMAARNAWFETGAVPDFPGGPSELDQLAIRANIAARSGDADAARTALAELDEKRGNVPIGRNGKSAGDIRDLDDRIPHALEVLTNGGRYLWIDYGRIESLTIDPMSRPRDLAFRGAGDVARRRGRIRAASGDLSRCEGRCQPPRPGNPMERGRPASGNRARPALPADWRRCGAVPRDRFPSAASDDERQIARG